MTQPDEDLPELEQLLSAVCDGHMTEPQGKQLDLLLRENPAARLAYLQYMHLQASLFRQVRAQRGEGVPDDTRWISEWKLLSEAEDVPPEGSVGAAPNSAQGPRRDGRLGDKLVSPDLADLPDTAGPVRAPSHLRSGRTSASQTHRVGHWSIAGRSGWRIAAGVLLAVGVMAVLWRHAHKPAASVAMVLREVNARWDHVASAPRSGLPLPAGALTLVDGVVQIRFGTGTTAIVQAPAQFQVESASRILLNVGRLTALVPAPAAGFTVRTPHATVTDLGTEFGVSVNSDGTTDVHVFQGRVSTAPLASEGKPQVLEAGQAASVSPSGVTLKAAGAMPQAFVRSMGGEKRLDVVDLVCGGDGTSEKRGTAIDATGRVGAIAPVGDQRGDGGYHTVPSIPVIDGCCIPNGSGGPVQVDSAGHAFAFPATSGMTFNHIWAGGAPPAPPGYRPTPTQLGGVDYAAAGHALIFMHSNKCLTLDLGAIRRLHPGAALIRFRCTAGIAPLPPQSPLNKADAYVLVDGQSRYERRQFRTVDGPFAVDVPLAQQDRFLTLATTDGGDTIGHDYVLWGDPLLELQD